MVVLVTILGVLAELVSVQMAVLVQVVLVQVDMQYENVLVLWELHSKYNNNNK